MIWKINIIGKYIYFSSATFWNEVPRFGIKVRISLRTVVLKIWNFSQNIRGIFLKMHCKIRLFQVDSLQLAPVLCIKKWCSDSEIQTLKSCFNTFDTVDSPFLVCMFTLFFLIHFSKHLRIKIDEFPPH